MKIAQINLDRCKMAMELYVHRCLEQKIYLGIVAEPNKMMTDQNPKWITDERIDAAIYIPTKDTKVRNTGCGQGFVWAETDGMLVFSCYASPRMELKEFQEYLTKICGTIKKQTNKKKILIGGDFNAKAYSWGSPREDKKGSALAEWASENDFIILNDGKTPTFERCGGSSYIDISLCTTNAGRLIRNWYVSDEENLSYHKSIYIEMEEAPEIFNKRRKKGWIYKEEKKDDIIDKAAEYIKNPNYTHEAHELNKVLKDVCNSTLKRKNYSRQRRSMYWWNEEIAELRRICTRAKRTTTRTNKKNVAKEVKEQARNNYRYCRNMLKWAIQKAKREKWKLLCSEVEDDLWGTGYKIVTGKLGLRSPITATDKEQLKIARELFPEHQRVIWTKEVCTVDSIPLCTVDEIRLAGARIKAKKAAGPDGIPPEVVKVIAMHKPELLTDTINKLFKMGIFPIKWKVGQLTLIEKPSKNGEKKAYRPICLINSVGKLFEQIVNRRLIEEIEKGEGFSPMQFGFRQGRSTIDALQIVKNIAEEVKLCPNAYVALITLDVKNAFNSAPWRGIVHELKQRKIAPYLINIICSYLENRAILIGEGSKLDMTCGVPQGSVLGPTLWNVYYDGVLNQDTTEATTIVGYADDLALVIRGETRAILEERIEWSVGRIESWMTGKGLQLAPQKTEVVILAGRRTIRDLQVTISGIQITSKKKVKYLGIQMGHNLNMGAHIQSVTEKAEKAIAALSRLMPNVGGPRANKRRLLGNVVDSIILYGAPIWGDWVEKDTYRKLIEKPQRKVAIRIVSAYRTVSTKAIQVIAGTVPIHLLVKERINIKNVYDQSIKKTAAREETLKIWQQEWDKEEKTAQWTKRLIPSIRPWIKRKHGEVGYHLAQFLTGHGCFKSYLFNCGLVPDDACPYCGERDTPEHIFYCPRWQDQRREIGDMTVEAIVKHMLDSEKNCADVIKEILTVKHKEATKRYEVGRHGK